MQKQVTTVLVWSIRRKITENGVDCGNICKNVQKIEDRRFGKIFLRVTL